MKGLVRSVVLLAFVFAASIQAATVYNVSDATGVYGGHGLWTNQDFGDGSDSEKYKNYFSIQAGSTLTVDKTTGTGSAILDATAKNGDGLEADIQITFTEYVDDMTAGDYKQEGGLPYDGNNVDFFTSILGTITIDNMIYDIDDFIMFNFQIGLGANAKSKTAFGASAWINCGDGARPNTDCMSSDHWDLNLDLTPTPIPGALVLFGMGLAGLGVIRKRSVKA